MKMTDYAVRTKAIRESKSPQDIFELLPDGGASLTRNRTSSEVANILVAAITLVNEMVRIEEERLRDPNFRILVISYADDVQARLGAYRIGCEIMGVCDISIEILEAFPNGCEKQSTATALSGYVTARLGAKSQTFLVVLDSLPVPWGRPVINTLNWVPGAVRSGVTVAGFHRSSLEKSLLNEVFELHFGYMTLRLRFPSTDWGLWDRLNARPWRIDSETCMSVLEDLAERWEKILCAVTDELVFCERNGDVNSWAGDCKVINGRPYYLGLGSIGVDAYTGDLVRLQFEGEPLAEVVVRKFYDQEECESMRDDVPWYVVWGLMIVESIIKQGVTDAKLIHQLMPENAQKLLELSEKRCQRRMGTNKGDAAN